MDDLISRQSAIDAVKKYMGDYEKSRTMQQVMRLLPSAEPDVPDMNVGKWISCSERLPEKGEKVLASTKNTIFTQVFKGVQGTSDSWWWNNNTIKTIYAWMPLPEPWKGADE